MTNSFEEKHTYNWQLQPYKSWKGGLERNLFNVVNSILKKPIVEAVATSGGIGARPKGRIGATQLATKTPATINTRVSRVGNAQVQTFIGKGSNKPKNNSGLAGAIGSVARIFGPQPLKHWRLQLNTVSDVSGNIIEAGVYNKKSVSDLMDKPGATHIINKPDSLPSLSACTVCDPNGNGQFSIEYFNRELLWNIDISFAYPGDKFLDCSSNNGVCRTACVACNPENNVIRSAVTLLNKNYYTDSRAYLRSRCKTYKQNLNITQLADPSSQFIPNTKSPAFPNDKSCGPQSFLIGTCPDFCQSGANLCGKNIPPNPNRSIAIYKPNNRGFAQQGAVTSSTRIAKLRYQTITKNAATFTTAFGAQSANAARYTANSNGPYFLKNKKFNCGDNINLFTRTGNQNLPCKGISTPQQLGLIREPGGFSGCSGILGNRNAICVG